MHVICLLFSFPFHQLLLKLQYWASSLKVYKGHYNLHLNCHYYSHNLLCGKGQLKHELAIQRYLHDLMGEVSQHMLSIASALRLFVEVGMWPIILAIFDMLTAH